MRAWPVYLAFGAILAGSLTAKGRAGDALVNYASLEPAVTRVAAAHDLAFLGTTTLPRTDISALEFAAPGCSRPLLVITQSVIIDLEPVVHAARKRGDVLHYVYIGRRWDYPDRRALFVERMKYAALATFGLTQYVPSQTLLVIERPTGCGAVDAIDWRDVWNRDYLKAAAPAAAEVKG